MTPRPAFIRLATIAIAASAVFAAASAAAVEALDESVAALGGQQEWQVRRVEVRGTSFLSEGEAKTALLTRARPWYRPWESRADFDPAMLERDVDRLLRAYEDEGFFLAEITAGVRAVEDEPLVDVWFEVEEGERARVASVLVECDPPGECADVALPIAASDAFTGAAYRAGQDALTRAWLERAYAHVEVERRASVDVARLRVDVFYRVVPGELAEFADTRVEGLAGVDSELVRREFRYSAGEPFSIAKLERTRRDLLALDLFSSVRFEVDPDDEDGAQVPVLLKLQEKAPRELRVGVGYSTEEEYGAHLAWSHANWLGGGRRLSVSGRYSTIKWSGDVDLEQPFLFGRRHGSGQLRASVFQEDEDTYLVDAVGGLIGVERNWGDSEALVTAVGFEILRSDVSNVNRALAAAIGGVRDKELAVGPVLGLRWDTRDKPFSPTTGSVISLDASQFGVLWGGDYKYYKLEARASRYFGIGYGFVLAARIHLGVADAIGESENLPVFERLFAGGESSVRGYERRQLGPQAGGDPTGGRSLVEGSVELRRLIWGDLGAVVFIDAGQISLDPFDFDASDLEFSAGPGLTYMTPIGPLSLFAGFPFDPPRGESSWQIHFSIGQFF